MATTRRRGQCWLLIFLLLLSWTPDCYCTGASEAEEAKADKTPDCFCTGASEAEFAEAEAETPDCLCKGASEAEEAGQTPDCWCTGASEARRAETPDCLDTGESRKATPPFNEAKPQDLTVSKGKDRSEWRRRFQESTEQEKGLFAAVIEQLDWVTWVGPPGDSWGQRRRQAFAEQEVFEAEEARTDIEETEEVAEQRFKKVDEQLVEQKIAELKGFEKVAELRASEEKGFEKITEKKGFEQVAEKKGFGKKGFEQVAEKKGLEKIAGKKGFEQVAEEQGFEKAAEDRSFEAEGCRGCVAPRYASLIAEDWRNYPALTIAVSAVEFWSWFTPLWLDPGSVGPPASAWVQSCGRVRRRRLSKMESRTAFPLRVIGYNPMSVARLARFEQGVEATDKMDAVLLAGTGLKDDVGEGVSRRQVLGRTVISAGWSRGSGSNKSCGTAIVLGRRFKLKHVMATSLPPAELQGRGLAARMRSGYFDICFLIGYFPPRPSSAGKWQSYNCTVKKLMKWMEHELSRMPKQCTPVIFFDLNDGLGLQRSESGRGWEWTEVQCVTKEAARRENGCAGKLMREMLEKHGLCSISASLDARDTWYGNRGQSSLIDHLCIPLGLVRSNTKAGVLARLGKEIQCIETTLDKRDHLPLFFQGSYLLEHRRPEQWREEDVQFEQMDQDSLMLELMQGARRKEFIDELETAAGQFVDSPEAEELLKRNTADRYFQRVNEIILGVARKFFGKGKAAEAEWVKKAKEEKLELLAARRKLKGEGSTVEEIEERLKEINKQLRSVRRKAARKNKDSLTEELWEAWRHRRLAQVHRLVARLGYVKVGPKKRVYSTLSGALPTQDEWVAHWQKPGFEGGMKVEKVSWEAMTEEHEKAVDEMRQDNPAGDMHLGLRKRGWRDLWRLKKAVLCAPKRRVVPVGTCPCEVLLMILAPNWRRDLSRAGVGADRGRLRPAVTWRMLADGFGQVNRLDMAPISWHCSQAAVLRKNAKPGPPGKRVCHVLDAMGRAFYSEKIKALAFGPKPTSSADYGFHRNSNNSNNRNNSNSKRQQQQQHH